MKLMSRTKQKPGKRFTIKTLSEPGQGIVYRLQGYTLSGARVRLSFQDQASAEHKRAELENADETAAKSIRLIQTRLTESQGFDAERATAELPPGRSLLAAVRFSNDHAKANVVPVPFSTAYQAFLADKKREECREDTLRNLRARVGLLKRCCAELTVDQITRSHILELLRRDGISWTTADNDRRAFSSFFSWCLEQVPPLCHENPAAAKRRKNRATKEAEEPSVMPIERFKSLLRAAETYKSGKLLPYVVLTGMCGLRCKEASRITRDAINLPQKTITISAKIAKLRARRIVEIPPTALRWLRKFLRPDTCIHPRNFRKELNRLKALVGYGPRTAKNPDLEPWPQNTLRNTAITFHYALHANEGATASWAGTSPEIIHRCYRGLATAAQSKRFWALTPSTVL